jgi:hypothetical protein
VNAIFLGISSRFEGGVTGIWAEMDTILLRVRGRLSASGEAKGQDGESFDEAHDWFIVGKIETKLGAKIVDEIWKEST